MYFLESGESVHLQNKWTIDAVIEFRNKRFHAQIEVTI